VIAVSQRTIERVIGRLVTDEELRLKFTRSPRQTVAELSGQGWELSRLEVNALLAIDCSAPASGPRTMKQRDDCILCGHSWSRMPAFNPRRLNVLAYALVAVGNVIG
jgi:hypothetical protein